MVLLGIAVTGSLVAAGSILRGHANQGKGYWYWNPDVNYGLGGLGAMLGGVCAVALLAVYAPMHHSIVFAIPMVAIGAVGISAFFAALMVTIAGQEQHNGRTDNDNILGKFVPEGSTWQRIAVNYLAIGVALTSWAFVSVFAPPLAGFIACWTAVAGVGAWSVYRWSHYPTTLERVTAIIHFLGALYLAGLTTSVVPAWFEAWGGWVSLICLLLVIPLGLLKVTLKIRKWRHRKLRQEPTS